MLKSLAYQLATNVPEMRAIYTTMPSESVSKVSRLEEAFIELLQQPIQVRGLMNEYSSAHLVTFNIIGVTVLQCRAGGGILFSVDWIRVVHSYTHTHWGQQQYDKLAITCR